MFGEDESPDEAIARIDAVIRAIATHQDAPEDKEMTSRFLEALIGRLKAW